MSTWRRASQNKLLDYLRRAAEAGTPTIAAAKEIAYWERYEANGLAWVTAYIRHLNQRRAARTGG